MKQLEFFNQLTTEELIEELINEPFEKYFVQAEKKYLKHCKVLTFSKVYDVTIFNDQVHQSIINDVVDRTKYNKYSLKLYFEKYGGKP